MKIVRNQYLQIGLICLVVLAFASCQKNTNVESSKTKDNRYQLLSGSDSVWIASDTNFVPYADAHMIAERITPVVFRGGENKTITRDISSSLVLNDKYDKPVLYVFNYEGNGGFVVMSADYRYEPICAFVEEGNLSGNEKVPPMFKGWFATTREVIEAIREGGLTESIPGNRISWIKLTSFVDLEYLPIGIDRFIREYGMEDCEPFSFYNVTSLIATKWGQGCTYNDLIPYSCISDCGKAPTGCVATAGAMIAHYWAAPNSFFSYNYAQMHLSTGDTGIQRLMLNIGQVVNMNYDCGDGSSANTEDLSDFFNNFLYYTAPGNYDNYQSNSTWTVKSDLDAGRPVILDGCTNNATIFNWFNDGDCHSWICDGYRLTTSGCYPGRFHLRMNWGWNGYLNGYYYQSGEWPQNSTYQYSRSFLHNIHP